MICSDCGHEGKNCTCDIHHYVKTGEKRQKEPSLTEMARYIFEQNGGRWHEFNIHNGLTTCSCGYRGWNIEDRQFHINPTYTDDAGKVELLRIIEARSENADFVKFATRQAKKLPEYALYDLIIDTTGKLLTAAYNFLKGRAGK